MTRFRLFLASINRQKPSGMSYEKLATCAPNPAVPPIAGWLPAWVGEPASAAAMGLRMHPQDGEAVTGKQPASRSPRQCGTSQHYVCTPVAAARLYSGVRTSSVSRCAAKCVINVADSWLCQESLFGHQKELKEHVTLVVIVRRGGWINSSGNSVLVTNNEV